MVTLSKQPVTHYVNLAFFTDKKPQMSFPGYVLFLFKESSALILMN